MRQGNKFAVLSLLWTLPALALTGGDTTSQYKACLDLIAINPMSAADAAQYWGGIGGGMLALHCRAGAFFALRQFREAGEMYERLATSNETVSNLPNRVALLGRAGRSYLLAGIPQKAMTSLTAGLMQSPNDPALRQDRAVTHIGLKNYRSALEDLDVVIAQQPGNVDALIFRATAWRNLEGWNQAHADLAKALALDAGRSEAYLERGLLKAAGGDMMGAKTDWEYVLRLHPQGVVANAAQQNLKKLEEKNHNQ
ncbi:MAG: tetratricopeptide repeat protein [Holosporales bacterium]